MLGHAAHLRTPGGRTVQYAGWTALGVCRGKTMMLTKPLRSTQFETWCPEGSSGATRAFTRDPWAIPRRVLPCWIGCGCCAGCRLGPSSDSCCHIISALWLWRLVEMPVCSLSCCVGYTSQSWPTHQYIQVASNEYDVSLRQTMAWLSDAGLP